MLTDNAVYAEDVKNVVDNSAVDWNKFKGKNILITGATGLIGTLLVNVLSYADDKFSLNLKLHLLIRSIEKAEKLFGDRINNYTIYIDSVENFRSIDSEIDYIIHAASQTSSKGFVEKPVETFRTALAGTMNLLEIARNAKTEKFVFLSTMEVYGTPVDDTKITEDMKVSVQPANVRSCYPVSKIAAENLCCDYSAEYGLDVAVLRLTQTFGAGVEYNDGRVFAEFARCAIEEKDIVLKTKGETKRSYLYTTDAVVAILMVTTTETGRFEIYNVANEDTYCSVYEMAELVSDKCGNGKIKVCIEEQGDLSKFGYAPTLCMNLDTSKLKKLGWFAEKSLAEMYKSMINGMVV